MKTFDIDDSGFEFMQGIRRCGAFVYRVDISEGEKKMKTFDKKDVFSWANCNELRLATHGYVGNSLSDLACNIAPEGKVVLLSIDKNSALCFNVENKQDNLAKIYHFAFFLPADKVKEVEEKKWRPFKDSKEFIHTIKAYLGDSITFRYKKENEGNSSALITGFSKELYVTFGGRSYSYEQLFYYLEWFDGNTWQPFGVEE